ncbi:MAG: trypsin-like peptidase domain-containing protein [Candidatus Kerfeldbacteria bacterium]|nr:trypsin-like peptidase domain-containing protein [Candidatus Kerfeldbacteria bacterium]
MKKTILLLLVGLVVPGLVLAATSTTSKTTKPVTPAVTNIVVPEEEAVIKAYESTLPSVVSIVISQDLLNLAGDVAKQDIGGGTGFFVSSDGYIITNKHVVVRDNVDYTVVTSGGREYTGSVLGRDPLFDVAIVKVEGSGFKPAKLGDSDKIRIGSTVLAIGNVLAEFRNTVTRGIISGIGRTVTASGGGMTETLEGTIQTDASINPGNSGGPLINLKGEVIGINTAINREGEALGFAIPINLAKQALTNFKKHGKIVRTFMGVRYLMLNRTVARAYGLLVNEGAYVLVKNNVGDPGVVPGGPADKAGVQLGDVILEVNGQKLTMQKSLANAIAQYEPGQKVTLKILRGGTELKLEVPLSERTDE